METNNLDLWDKVGKTTEDTKTKEVSYWSRKFTAIDAYSQIKTATKEFGKYWEKWGFKKLDYQVIEWRLYFEWLFYYPDWEFPIMNDHKVWDDASKKVFTDSLTKALSYLGFNADVFMGQFEWNKYTDKSWSWDDKRGLMQVINDMKSAKTKEDRVKFKDEWKNFAKSEKQIKWLTDEWNKLK